MNFLSAVDLSISLNCSTTEFSTKKRTFVYIHICTKTHYHKFWVNIMLNKVQISFLCRQTYTKVIKNLMKNLKNIQAGYNDVIFNSKTFLLMGKLFINKKKCKRFYKDSTRQTRYGSLIIFSVYFEPKIKQECL